MGFFGGLDQDGDGDFGLADVTKMGAAKKTQEEA